MGNKQKVQSSSTRCDSDKANTSTALAPTHKTLHHTPKPIHLTRPLHHHHQQQPHWHRAEPEHHRRPHWHRAKLELHQARQVSTMVLERVVAAAAFFLAVTTGLVCAATDAPDVQALEILYKSLNSPPQLSGWKSTGGDPCGESWNGISCTGSAVNAIQIPGLGLSGSLGYLLSNLQSLRILDVSNNNINESIPYQLPPNLTNLNLASNHIFGSLPYSISSMASLNYLNVSHNLLSQPIGDIFANLQDLSVLDLSFNNFSGNLPNSFGSLANLSSLYLQNNELSGPVNVLANLDLDDLDISNNRFTGWIPREFQSIPDMRLEGNSFDNGPAPPPPPYVSPPNHKNHSRRHSPSSPGAKKFPKDHAKKGLAIVPLLGIVIGCILLGLCASLSAIFCFKKKSSSMAVEGSSKEVSRALPTSKDKGEWHRISDYISSYAPNEWSFRTKDPSPLNSLPGSSYQDEVQINKSMQEQSKSVPPSTHLKLPPVERASISKAYWRNGSEKLPRVPNTAMPYSIATLQIATDSFSQESLIGEGSLGRVYRADFSNGKVLAVKKIDCAALSIQEEDNFLEAISNMSRLRHPNITALLGYCTEHGQRLLVYEYIVNGTLHDLLYYTDDHGKVLTWNSRVKIALGTARALEYLHEVCLPPVIHKNIKSANILLDEELSPHLSDCGLALLTPNAERQVFTDTVGSFGYSAPEFAMSGVYTVKSDVYSLGVLMLELLTGRKPLDSSRDVSEKSLVKWATPQLHDIDALAKMVDTSLNGIYPAKSLSRFADIISLCVQPQPEFRPPMSEVVQSLVRLVQRTNISKRLSGDDFGPIQKFSEFESNADLRF